jgi:hypothetical protein
VAPDYCGLIEVPRLLMSWAEVVELFNEVELALDLSVMIQMALLFLLGAK